MDESAVRAVVETNLLTYMRAFGIPHWSVSVLYGRCSDESWAAECDCTASDYERATITLDPDRHDSEETVRASLRHELMHVVASPFDLYRDVMTQQLKAGSDMDRAESRLWRHCVEKAVKHLERMYFGLCENKSPPGGQKTQAKASKT